MSVTASTPRTTEGWEQTARRIAADVQRLPMVFRFLLAHLVLGGMEEDHRQAFAAFAEFSGAALPPVQRDVSPLAPDGGNPMFDATRAAHAITGAAPTNL